MTHGTLDDQYFTWLYSCIGHITNHNLTKSHWQLLHQLYITEFEWSVANDDNRSQDGLDLRFEFLDDQRIYSAPPAWMGLQCSMLEMLIALSRRASFESESEPGDWFWHFMRNMCIKEFTDSRYSPTVATIIRDRVAQVIDRTYMRDGSGGLFPLRHPTKDQRHVQLWDQLSAYLLEGDFIDHGPR